MQKEASYKSGVLNMSVTTDHRISVGRSYAIKKDFLVKLSVILPLTGATWLTYRLAINIYIYTVP